MYIIKWKKIMTTMKIIRESIKKSEKDNNKNNIYKIIIKKS